MGADVQRQNGAATAFSEGADLSRTTAERSRYFVTSTVTLTAGQWVHVSGSWQPGGKLYVSVGGTVRESTGNTPLTLADPGGVLRIGRAHPNSAPYTGYYKGKVDQVRLSNYARYTSSFNPTENYAVDSQTNVMLSFSEGSGSTTDDTASTRNTTLLTDISTNALPAWVSGVTTHAKAGFAFGGDVLVRVASLSLVTGLFGETGAPFVGQEINDSSTTTKSTTAWARRYVYDRWANRKEVWNAVTGGSQIQSVDVGTGVPTNRISRVTTEGVQGTAWTYDANGNVTGDGSGSAFGYDGANRLVSVDAGSMASYAYDSANRRVKKEVAGGATTYYVWEGPQVIAEYNGSGLLSAEYVYTGSRLLLKEEGGLVRYYLADRLSSRAVVDASGSVVGTMAHLPFGEDGGTIGASEKHRFTSYERDTETGDDYAVNRQYDPTTARFFRPDPLAGSISTPQSLNRYTYTLNDPVNFVDPLGLCEIQVKVIFKFLEGRQIGAFKREFIAVWAQAGVSVNFVQSGQQYTLTVLGMAPGGQDTTAGGSTPFNPETGFVYSWGSVYANTVARSAVGSDETRQLLFKAGENIGTALARAGAHEFGHSYFQQSVHRDSDTGLMSAAFAGDDWFREDRRGNWNFTASQRAAVREYCERWHRENPITPQLTPGLPGSLRNPFAVGLEVPWWYQALNEFLAWVDDIGYEVEIEEGPFVPVE